MNLTPRRRHRWVVLATSLIVTMLTASGCNSTAESSPRAVTTEESQLLAIARFKNFDTGTRSVSVEFTDSGQELALDGWFDYRAGVGYAALSDGGEPNSLLTWQTHTLAVHAPSDGHAPLPPPDVNTGPGKTWAVGPIDPTSSTLHAVLILVSELGRDRPENPLLLQQGGATWLNTDEVDGTNATVFGGPTGLAGGEPGVSADDDAPAPEARLRYWLADDGTMLRLEALLGQQWVTLDFGSADGVRLDYDVQVSP